MNIYRSYLVPFTSKFCDIKVLAFPFVGNSSLILKLPYQYSRSTFAVHQQNYQQSCISFYSASRFLEYRVKYCHSISSFPYYNRVLNHHHRRLSELLRLTMGKKAGGFYAVARGRSVGVFLTWDECKAQVDGFTNARYKKFPTSEDATAFIKEHSGGGVQNSAATHLAPCSYKYARKSTSTTKSIGIDLGVMGLQKPSSSKKTLSIIPAAPKRDFSSLKVTEDRVINKRAKMDRAASNSCVDLSNFNVDEEGFVVVYTDGACTKNGRKAAKAGIGVWFGHSHPLNISEPVEGRQTNNTAEIQAAERAIREAKLNGINKLKVKTDSQFTINCVTKWLNNWKRNNWRLSSGGDVKNKEDLVKLDDAMQNMEIKWSYVAGHAGIEGNEAADRLAVQGAERSKF